MLHDDHNFRPGLDGPEPTPYQEQKLTDRYGPISSQADVMREDAKMPVMYEASIADSDRRMASALGMHEAKMPGMYENSIAAGGCTTGGGSICPPHKFEPTQTGIIGAPCKVCGGLPGDQVHQLLNFDLTKPLVCFEKLSENKVSYEITNIPNDQAMRIITDVLPKVLELYLSKSRDYNGNVMSMLKLGPKASFVDLWRKIGKLKGALWDGNPMQGEQPDEILSDCVGHILITLDEMGQE